ncbi:MAG: 1-deoxy-D-xylulose-5-phosphate synthase, partial [Planctomycetota bacterium]|nr:1-deoxy-D-xylulose-5-phosphate synthase [Planctomycetota bacterium]
IEIGPARAAALADSNPAAGAGGGAAVLSVERRNGGSAEAKAEAVAAGENDAPPYTDVMIEALIERARSDRRIVAITAAMPTGTGLARFAEEFPDRYYDVGICEPHAVTFAAGLAKAGLKPVVCIYSTFMQRAADNLMHDVSLQGGLPVVFLMDRAGLVGTDGATHHGLLDLAYTLPLPHFVCMAPKDAEEAVGMLRLALSLNKPAAIRYPRDRAPKRIGTGLVALEPGKGEVLRRGKDVAVLAYGSAVAEAMSAAEDLAEEGIGITVANARFAKPLDAGLLGDLLATHRKVITVEEHQKINGFGAMAAAEAAAHGMDAGRLFVMGVGDEYVEHGPRAWQLAVCGLDAPGIAGAVRQALRGTPAG